MLSVKKFHWIYLFLIFNLIVWMVLLYYYYFLQLHCLIWCWLSLKFFVFVGFRLGFILYLCMCRMYWESEIFYMNGYFYVGINFMFFTYVGINFDISYSYAIGQGYYHIMYHCVDGKCIGMFVFAFLCLWFVTVVVEIVMMDQW